MTKLDELLTALDEAPGDTESTSVRQPVALRRALKTALDMGFAANANEAVNTATRAALEAFAQRAALDEHYALHPESRPALDDVAHALAVLDHSPLADRRDLIAQAAVEVVAAKPSADGDDVLLWAASLLVHERPHRRVPA
jgi:hypothetical protein